MKKIRIISLVIAIATAISSPIYAETISQMMAASRVHGDDLNLPSFVNSGKEKKKSKFLALGLSIILPGAGQYYTENKKKMAIFGGIEALVWTSFAGMRTYGAWKKEDYRAWAAFHAGADVNNKPDLFYEKMTYYDNIDEYNQLALLFDGGQATLFDPNAGYYWNWDSKASRDHYRTLRNQSKNAYNRSLFLLGGALFNRIFSGIDAYRSAGDFGGDQEFGLKGWQIYYSASGPIQESEVKFGLVRHF